jgi:hypothetical protein
MKRGSSFATLRRSVVRRRGAAMVYVLILLLVISMVGTTLVRATIAQHRQRLRDELRAQTVRLMEAGWNRAVNKLAEQPDYAGEIWRLGPDVFGADRRAEVRIDIVSAESAPNQRRLTVIAEYPVGETFVNRISQTGLMFPQGE